MLKNFRSYQLAVQFYQTTRELRAPNWLTSQACKAAHCSLFPVSLFPHPLPTKDKSKRHTRRWADRDKFWQLAVLSLVRGSWAHS